MRYDRSGIGEIVRCFFPSLWPLILSAGLFCSNELYTLRFPALPTRSTAIFDARDGP